MQLSLKNTIKQWFYRDYYFQWWRWYLRTSQNEKKRKMGGYYLMAWFWTELELVSKDQFITNRNALHNGRATEDINAINEQEEK